MKTKIDTSRIDAFVKSLIDEILSKREGWEQSISVVFHQENLYGESPSVQDVSIRTVSSGYDSESVAEVAKREFEIGKDSTLGLWIELESTSIYIRFANVYEQNTVEWIQEIAQTFFE